MVNIPQQPARRLAAWANIAALLALDIAARGRTVRVQQLATPKPVEYPSDFITGGDLLGNPVARAKAPNPKLASVNVRLSNAERAEMEKFADRGGFRTVSDYLRHLHDQAKRGAVEGDADGNKPSEESPAPRVSIHHSTRLGTMLCGDSLAYLRDDANRQSVDLIVTSPPFGLVRKKTYGNEDAHLYCDTALWDALIRRQAHSTEPSP